MLGARRPSLSCRTSLPQGERSLCRRFPFSFNGARNGESRHASDLSPRGRDVRQDREGRLAPGGQWARLEGRTPPPQPARRGLLVLCSWSRRGNECNVTDFRFKAYECLARGAPLCPVGHLSRRGRDRCAAAFPFPSTAQEMGKAVTRAISPLAGEMSDRTERGASRREDSGRVSKDAPRRPNPLTRWSPPKSLILRSALLGASRRTHPAAPARSAQTIRALQGVPMRK